MIQSVSWLLAGIPLGYVIMDFTDLFHYKLFKTHLSNSSKYTIVISIALLAFLRGYTGNGLVTNLQKIELLQFDIADGGVLYLRDSF